MSRILPAADATPPRELGGKGRQADFTGAVDRGQEGVVRDFGIQVASAADEADGLAPRQSEEMLSALSLAV